MYYLLIVDVIDRFFFNLKMPRFDTCVQIEILETLPVLL